MMTVEKKTPSESFQIGKIQDGQKRERALKTQLLRRQAAPSKQSIFRDSFHL